MAHADDDISRLLRRMVDTMDRSTGEASRQVFAYIRTIGVIDALVDQVDALGSEVATLEKRVRKLEKAARATKKHRKKNKKSKK